MLILQKCLQSWHFFASAWSLEGIVGFQRPVAAIDKAQMQIISPQLQASFNRVEDSHFQRHAVWTAPRSDKDKLQHDSEISARRMMLLVQPSQTMALHKSEGGIFDTDRSARFETSICYIALSFNIATGV